MKTVPIENSRQVGLLVASTISIFIVIVAVALRLIAKRMSSGLDYSEYCIIAALIWNTILHATLMLLVTHGGFGFHLTEIFQRFGPDTATFFFKGIMAFALLWNATVCFSKLSVLLMYVQLIPMPSMIKWAKIMGGIIIAWNVGDIIVGFLICRPLARNWNFAIPGTCGSQPKFYFSMGIINIISDIFLLAMPMPYLYKLKMSMRKKLIAGGMLSIGIMTWVITIYRQTLLPSLDFNDMTYEGVLATLLSGLEPAVAIALACLPLLRPLFPSWRSKTKTGSDYNSGYGSNSAGGMYSKKMSSNRSATRTFTQLEDDHVDVESNSSEVQLRPMKPAQNVKVSVGEDRMGALPAIERTQAIAVEKKWEVTSN